MRMYCVKCDSEYPVGMSVCPKCDSVGFVPVGSMTKTKRSLYAELMPRLAALAGCRSPSDRAALRSEISALRSQLVEQSYAHH